MASRLVQQVGIGLSLSFVGAAVHAESCIIDPVTPCALEGEACNEGQTDVTNGGCTSMPAAFGAVAVDGQPICGTNWAMNGLRDTDWYAFQVDEPVAVEIEVHAETDTVAFLARLSPGGACPVTGIPDGSTAFSAECDTVHEVGSGFMLAPADYVLFISTGTPDGGGILDGFPCPSGGGGHATTNTYQVQLRTPPPACPWDLNGDGTTDFADVLMIIAQAAHWGQACTGTCPDLNGNGLLDFGDLLEVIGHWGPCPTG